MKSELKKRAKLHDICLIYYIINTMIISQICIAMRIVHEKQQLKMISMAGLCSPQNDILPQKKSLY